MFFKTNSESEIIKVWKSVNSLLNEVKAYEVITYKNLSFLGHPVCTHFTYVVASNMITSYIASYIEYYI